MTSITRLGLHSRATRLRGERLGLARFRGDQVRGFRPPWRRPSSRLRTPACPQANVLRLQFAGTGQGPRDSVIGLCPLRSPLLGTSLLVSFPPVINMLKFTGCSRPIRGRWCRRRSTDRSADLTTTTTTTSTSTIEVRGSIDRWIADRYHRADGANRTITTPQARG